MAQWGKDGLMGTITKKDLVERIAEGTGLRRTDVKTVVQSFLDHVIQELGEGNRLEFPSHLLISPTTFCPSGTSFVCHSPFW